MDWFMKRQFNSIYCSLGAALLALGLFTTITSATAQSLTATETQSKANPNLLQQGRVAYERGRYAEATAIWERAGKNNENLLNNLDQALIYSYLSLSNHKQGNLTAAENYIHQSLKILTSQPELKNNSLKIYAQALNTQGTIQLTTGKAESAYQSWQQAADIYQQAGDEIGLLGSQINQAQALQSLGLYRRSQKLLEQIAQKLDQQQDKTLKLIGLRSLGIALQVTGDLKASQKFLNQSLEISQQLNLSEETSATLFSLGNTARALEDYPGAIAFYQQAAATTSQPLLETEAQLNQLSLLIAEKQWQKAQVILSQIQENISNLSTTPNRRSIYAQVNFAKSLIDLSEQNSLSSNYRNLTENLLKTATQQAQQLQDSQAESYGLGILGHLYEQQQQWSLARQNTAQALELAQLINASDLTYQWQWQLGRLLARENNHSGAIAAYTQAVEALESLRSDLVLTNVDTQFSFRESVEPVYRELVSLLLQPQNNQEVSQAHILQARDTIEALQLAELNNFFREACLDVRPTKIDRIDPKAAVIYPIILRDRLEVIVSLPEQPLRHYSTNIPQEELEAAIEEFRQTVTIRSRRKFYQPAQQLYSWLIRPALKDLELNNIETLVFIPDGTFRNIPLAAIHDGKQYLLEQYNIALTPGLQLLAPLPLEQLEFKTLAAGITQARRGFAPLNYVALELEEIQNQTNSTILRDGEFTKEALQEKIADSDFPIVHIATHGQFSSNLDETFILAWDSQIHIKQLDSILQAREQTTDFNSQRAIELLVLSACETATGDKRAALGLAGMSVRAGARTTLATLWTVHDQSTAITINNFYQHLTQPQVQMTKAKALRQAQLDLINSNTFNHPYYWAAFVLVGNWL
ncbi:MAG: hypothetical protein Tsb0014_39130 [Pleurocapsa sp.]